MKFAAFGLLVGITCASAAPASAQYATTQSEKSVELSLINGYYIGSDIYNAVGSGADTHIGLSNSYMWGARIGMDPNPRMGVEFAYTRIGSDIEAKNPPAGFTTESLGRLNGNEYDVNFNFYQEAMGSKAKGYFSLGLGWTVTDPDIKAATGKTIDSNSLFAWNFGLGTKVTMNEKLALRLEGRWRITDTAISTSTGVYCDYWGYCYSYSSDWYNSGELTAGLTYKMGGR
jgi:opacity protein-like surface antigen